MRKEFEKGPGDFILDPEQIQKDLQDAKDILGWLEAENLTIIEIASLKRDIERIEREREGFYGTNTRKNVIRPHFRLTHLIKQTSPRRQLPDFYCIMALMFVK